MNATVPGLNEGFRTSRLAAAGSALSKEGAASAIRFTRAANKLAFGVDFLPSIPGSRP